MATVNGNAPPAPPTGGLQSRVSPGGLSVAPWSSFTGQVREHVPELRGQKRNQTYERMRSTDSQVWSLADGTLGPIELYRWWVHPNGNDEGRVALLAEDFGLPVGEPDEDDDTAIERTSLPDEFDFGEMLHEILLGPMFGHYFFEWAFQDPAETEGLYRLAGMSPIHPSTIREIRSDPQGRLMWIQQDAGSTGTILGGAVLRESPKITAPSLLPFVFMGDASCRWSGRALDPETPIPTPDGWRTMDDLHEGDRIFDEEGKVRHVVGRLDWADRPCYEVSFSSGESIIADANHQWVSYTGKSRILKQDPELVTTAEMAEAPRKYTGRGSYHAVQKAGALEYVRQGLTVDPYVLGYWLGDGDTGAPNITTMDIEIVHEFERRGYPSRELPRAPSVKPTRANRYAVYGDLGLQLRGLGLIGDKHVPEHYFRGDYAQRLDLLRGLMDADGNVGGKNGQRGEFTNTNKRLSEAVLELARSVGGTGRLQYVKRGVEMVMGRPTQLKDVWRVNFTTPAAPFLLPRKAERYDGSRKSPRRYHYVQSVERVSNRRTVCIETDGPSHLFLAGRSLIPSHNSLFRPMYRNWLCKDVLMRVDVDNHSKAGGVPVVRTDNTFAGVGLEDLQRLASEFRVDQDAGAAMPPGAWIELLTAGTGDVVGSMRWHDEQMAQVWHAMVRQLGTTATGSRALGGTLVDLEAMGRRSIAEWARKWVNRWAFARWWMWNFGERNAPVLRFTAPEIESAAPTPAVPAVPEPVAAPAPAE